MKINNKLNEIKVGRIYHWDVSNTLSGIHNGTEKVKVLNIQERINASPLAEVQSIETKGIFPTDVSHLQLDPEYLKTKYNKLIHYYKKNNPKMIFQHTSPVFNKIKKYIIIGNLPEVNCLRCLDKNGEVHSIEYAWFEDKGLDLKRNDDFDREQQLMMEEFADDFEYDYYDRDDYISNEEIKDEGYDYIPWDNDYLGYDEDGHGLLLPNLIRAN